MAAHPDAVLRVNRAKPVIIRSSRGMARWRAALKGTVGLVPTLGALHDGHASLIKKAAGENRTVIVSVFVNPLQFTPEGYKAYPRTLAADVRLARAAGAAAVFAPSVNAMYPPGFESQVIVPKLFEALSPQNLEWHYRGVLAVVMKLFQITRPDNAYFGLKDPHQLALIERMVADFDIAVRIRRCPTVREKSGLARSSRNALLSPAERAAAPVIYRGLRAAKAAVKSGKNIATALGELKAIIAAEPLARLEYTEVADPATFTLPTKGSREAIIFAAVWIGDKRLADNIRFRLK